MINKTALRRQVIYQVFVRQFSETHDFKGVIKELDRIKSLGTDIIYLLPFYPIGKLGRKGSIGSPYAIYDYRKIDPLNGTLADFQELIYETHQRGMKIIIDMVLNHTSRDSVLLQEHEEWFYHDNGMVGNKAGDWSDVCDLDYTKEALHEEIINMLENWLKLGVDGFRMDVCSLVPGLFWEKAVKALKAINPDFIMLGESVELSFVRYLRKLGYNSMSDSEAYHYFDMLYSYDINQSQGDFFYRNGSLNAWLMDIINQDARYPLDYVKARYLDNHDQERIARYHHGNNLKNLWALNFYLKGITFIYAGDEVCDEKLPSLFEIDPVVWDFSHDLSPLFAKLASIKKHDIYEKGFFDAKLQDKNIAYLTYTFEKQISLGLFNLTNEECEVRVDILDGSYHNLIDDSEVKVINSMIKLGSTPIIIETNR